MAMRDETIVDKFTNPTCRSKKDKKKKKGSAFADTFDAEPEAIIDVPPPPPPPPAPVEEKPAEDMWGSFGAYHHTLTHTQGIC